MEAAHAAEKRRERHLVAAHGEQQEPRWNGERRYGDR
jgi:hypothetical protein